MSSAGMTMHCAHCGRPAASGIWLNGCFYHAECTCGPDGRQEYYQATPSAPTEADIRRIVREEIRAALAEKVSQP